MPTKQTTVTGSFADITQAATTGAHVHFQVVSSLTFQPISYRNGAGQVVVIPPVSVALTSDGSFSVALDDVMQTVPSLIGYAVTVTDDATNRQLLGAGYGCIQPTGSEWSLAQYDPRNQPGVTNTPVPGPAGPPLTVIGEYDPGFVYAKGWVATQNVGGFITSYASEQDGNSGHALSDTTWWKQVNGPSAGVILNFTTASAVPSGVDGGTPAGDGVIVDAPFTSDQTIKSVKVRVYSGAAGAAVRFFIMNGGSGSYGVADFFDVTLPATVSSPTDVTWNVGADFAAKTALAGQQLGWYSATARFAYGSGVSQSTYLIGSEPSGATPVTWAQLAGLSIPFTVTGQSVATVNLATTDYVTTTVTDAIASLPQPVTNTGRTMLWSEPFASLPANWASTAAAFTASGGLLSPASGQGYGTAFVFSRYFNLESRTIRVAFQVTAAGTVMGFGSVQSPSAFADGGSLVTVDGSANTLNICNPFTSGSNPGVLISEALGFAISTGNVYVLTLIQDERELTATLADPVTGKVASVKAGDNLTNSGLTAPWNKLNDFPAFVAIAGQFSVSKMEILANIQKPHAYLCGDSLTWGVGVTVAQRWATLLGEQLPAPACVVSGRPGGTSVGALAKMTSEVQYLLPKFVILLIGTNDNGNGISLSTTLANIAAAATAAQGYGATVLVCLLPTSSSNQAWVTSVNNGLIAAAMPGVSLVYFDKATSVGNDGVTQDASLFISDGTHVNALGSIQCFNRFQGVPSFIFD